MLARLQQAITVSLILLATSWVAWFGLHGLWGWALAGALSILFGYALFLGLAFGMVGFIVKLLLQWILER